MPQENNKRISTISKRFFLPIIRRVRVEGKIFSKEMRKYDSRCIILQSLIAGSSVHSITMGLYSNLAGGGGVGKLRILGKIYLFWLIFFLFWGGFEEIF